jgi:hypothetical protein
MPEGVSFELALPPRLESWNRYSDPAQVALREFVAHVHELIDPVIDSTAGSLAFRLDVGLAEDIDPLWERDLDNYLFPIARTLPNRVVSVWGTKGRAALSRARIEPAVEENPRPEWLRFEVPPVLGTERSWKPAVRKVAARKAQLPAGPVALQLSFALGPDRNWLSMWKPSIDGLEPLLGRTYEDREWNPLDGRIVRLGLHRHINAGLGRAVAMAGWARPADEAWPELVWLTSMSPDERAVFLEQHAARRPRGERSVVTAKQPPTASPRMEGRPAARLEAPGVEVFRDDDEGYMRWLADNPNGYVLNLQRSLNPSDARVHQARCSAITGVNPRRGPWTGAYIKLCSPVVEAIDRLSAEQFGSPIARCHRCHPRTARQ